MRDDDCLVVIASDLLPQEAGMARGILESAGIRAFVRDEMLSAIDPFARPMIGGVKLAVRAADAERAIEIVRSSGAVPGPIPDEPIEIPEQEWAANPRPPEEHRTSVAPPWYRAPVTRFGVVVIVALLLLRCLAGA